MARRDEAFATGDRAALRAEEKEVKAGRRRDKRIYLNEKLADGTWDSTRSFRKPFTVNPPCLRDKGSPPGGTLRPASERAQIMAEYFNPGTIWEGARSYLRNSTGFT